MECCFAARPDTSLGRTIHSKQRFYSSQIYASKQNLEVLCVYKGLRQAQNEEKLVENGYITPHQP